MYAADIKYNIVNIFMIILTVILYPVSQRMSSVEESCRVHAFDVDPRFKCHKECTTESAPENAPICDILTRETEDRSAYLCYKKKYGLDGFEEYEEYEYYYPEDTFDPSEYDDYENYYENMKKKGWVCPNEPEICDGGQRMMEPHAKCNLYCPLAFNVTVEYHLRSSKSNIRMNRDLSTDAERFTKYRDHYTLGKDLTCRVYSQGRRVYFFDDPLSEQSRWWIWLLFVMSFATTIFTSILSVRECISIRRHEDRSAYPPLIPGTGTATGRPRVVLESEV